jgi:hypothetical protein
MELAAFCMATIDGVVTAAVTVRVIGKLSGVLLAPLTPIVTVPEYVPAAKPAGLMLTETFDGVVPAVDETESHAPPEEVVADAVNGNAAPLETDIASVCGVGFALPTWKLTGCSELGLTPIVTGIIGVEVAVRVTGIDSVPPVPDMMIEPE